MDDRRDDRDDRPRSERRGERGPRDSAFLDLEISQVLYGEADQLCRDAARELLREAIRERLQERLGDRLREIGRLAADILADDFETNLQIESLIDDRREARASIGDRVREIVQRASSPSGRTAAASKKRPAKKRTR